TSGCTTLPAVATAGPSGHRSLSARAAKNTHFCCPCRRPSLSSMISTGGEICPRLGDTIVKSARLIGDFPHGVRGLMRYILPVSLLMGTACVLLGVFGFLLGILAVRIGLHELCHGLDGEKTRPPGRAFINPRT